MNLPTTESRRSTSTVDGVIRNAQVDLASLPEGPWDGVNYGYVPPVMPRFDESVILHEDFDRDIDPVSYQVLRSRFWNLNLDHSDTIKRVSGSPLIVYMDDFNTSLLTECGDSVVCGPSIQYFTGHGDLVVKWTLENRSANPGIHDGDVFLQNDPYIGATHQMDTALYAPVFWEGKLFCWIMNAAHVGDIGGVDPGSFCPSAPDMFHESTPVPPIKLVREGVMQNDVAEMFVRKSRTPEMIALQLRSQIAGLRITRERVLEMLAENGPLLVKGAMRKMIKDCSEAVGRRLESIPDGEWQETIYLGSAGPNDRDVHRLVTRLRKEGDRLIFTNEGSDRQFYAANASFSAWRSGAVCATSAFLAYDQLYCPAGAADHMEFRPIPGTMNVAKYPGAVTPGTGAIVSVYLASQVISKMLLTGPPDVRAAANATGGVSLPGWWVASGLNRHGNFVADLTGDSLNGSIGAFPDRDGVDTGGAWWWPRSKSGNLEEWETALPIMYLYRREQIDSGGAGRWRGGNGVEIAVVPHKTAQLNAHIISSDPAINTSPGLAGGRPGHSGNYKLAADSTIRDHFAAGRIPADRPQLEAMIGALPRISPKTNMSVGVTDVFCVSYSAGGGFGDSLRRAPELVVADVVNHRIMAASALEKYGVVIDASGALDAEATVSRRAALRKARLAMARVPQGDTASAPVMATGGIASVADMLGITFVDGDACWACIECSAVLASAKENFKLGAAVIEAFPEEIDPVMYASPSDFCDIPYVMRQYLCPSCGSTLSIETCRQDDLPIMEINFSERGLTALRERIEAVL